MKSTRRRGPLARLRIKVPSEIVVEADGQGKINFVLTTVKRTPDGGGVVHLTSFYYGDWPREKAARLEYLRRQFANSPGLAKKTALLRRLVPLVTRAAEALDRRRHEFGVPVAELPGNFSSRLRMIRLGAGPAGGGGEGFGYSLGRVTAAATVAPGAAQTLDVGPGPVAVFADLHGVFLGPPQDRRARGVSHGEAGRLFTTYAALEARALEPAAIVRRGLREGSLWFAEAGLRGRNSRPSIDLRYFVYLRKRFGGDLSFFRMVHTGRQTIGAQSGGRWVAFVECRFGTTTGAVERLVEEAAARKGWARCQRAA